MSLLHEAGKEVVEFGGIMPNPTYAKVQEGAHIVREQKIDFILAVGGGSVSDCCKIVSAQARLNEDIWNYENQKCLMPTDFVPMGVVVTASGTGSEENNSAVITHEELRIKQDLWGPYPEFSILDPDLTKTVPMKQVISGAFDTLSHCMETYFGRPYETNVSDEINESVQRNIIRNLRRIAKNPEDDFARSELMWDSAMAENNILKIGKQTDFQCHMIEHQLGAYTDCNHGQGLAVLHPTLYRHIYPFAKEKFTRWAQVVWFVQDAEDGIDALENLIREVGLPTSLFEMGISLDEETIQAIAESTIIRPGCCKQLTAEEIVEIFRKCI
jgi:alcohol dehydrogenase YqhD (iron-dependent ADH family)